MLPWIIEKDKKEKERMTQITGIKRYQMFEEDSTDKQKKIVKIVKKKLMKGERICKTEIAKKVDCNISAFTGVTVQKASEKIIRIIDNEINRTVTELGTRDLSVVPYIDLVRGMDIMVKNHQLLNNKATERVDLSSGGKPLLDAIRNNNVNQEAIEAD